MSQGQLTQDNRLISIGDFSLGKDTFLLTAFEGSEYISGLFEFHIEVLSENLEVKPEQVIGKTTAVKIHSKVERVFHGYIKSFSFGEAYGHNIRTYRMTMVPWLWFLSQTNNHRIFQEQNTKDIVSKVFNDLGFTDFDFRASGGKRREYCIQHNESDLHFVSRLLEEEGIAYFFKHSAQKHTLVLVDQKNAYDEVEETGLMYSRGTGTEAEISAWEHLYTFRKGQWSLNDFNFKEPKKDLKANTKTNSKFANNAKYEHYEYPGLYESTLGNDLVKVRLDAEEADRNMVAGEGNCCSFYAGGRFGVDKHITAAEKGDYILVSVSHRAHETNYLTNNEAGTGYSNSFVCIPSSVHFRPKLTHVRPVMKGPQSAIVVGPSGEEIYVDEFGRIKVQFIWDREGKKDENSSCWIRVMQSWAGNQWGSSFIPRIGHEVIVNFLDGDPDRPIVVGSVYNGWNKPPFESKTQSGIRTRSTKEGSPQNFNELRFDDKKGSEQIYLHAEKNLDIVVENDETHEVGNDRTKHIKHDENSTIDNNRNKTIGNNQSESVTKNNSINIGENQDETIGKNLTISVGENHTESIGKNMSITIGKDLTEEVGGKYAETVTKEYGLKAKEIVLQADDQITLKTGSAKIVMKKNGDITISGKNINVKGSGNVVLKGSKVTAN